MPRQSGRSKNLRRGFPVVCIHRQGLRASGKSGGGREVSKWQLLSSRTSVSSLTSRFVCQDYSASVDGREGHPAHAIRKSERPCDSSQWGMREATDTEKPTSQ